LIVLVVGEIAGVPLGRVVLRKVQALVVAGIVVAGEVEVESTCSLDVVVVAGLGMGRMRVVEFHCAGVGVGMVVAGTEVVLHVPVVDRSEVVGYQVVRGQLCRCSILPPP
jgi:hypothetical protein